MAGLLPEYSFPRIYGNSAAKDYLNGALSRNALPHALVIEGRKGSGRHTLVLSVASALAPDYEEKIFSGNEPDVMAIGHDDDHKTIGVDIIRNLKIAASKSANELDFKLFYMEDAETMTIQAQNALLKLLEEPPSDVFIFLLCESAGSLLPTVLSRAPVLRMQELSAEEIEKYLLENDKKAASIYTTDRETFDFAIRTSGGSIGEALRRMKSKSAGENAASERIDSIISALAARNKIEFFALASRLPQKRDELNLFMSIFEEALRDLIAAKAYTLSDDGGDCPMMYYRSSSDAGDIAAAFSLSSLYNMAHFTTELHENSDLNANVRLTGVMLAEKLWSAVML